MTYPMGDFKCRRCKSPDVCEHAFFVQTCGVDGSVKETEYELCFRCFEKLMDFLMGTDHLKAVPIKDMKNPMGDVETT
jgi:hypothetical protein